MICEKLKICGSLIIIPYEGNVARLDSRMLDHLFASR